MTDLRTSATGRYQTDWPTAPAGPPPPVRHPLGFMHELPFLVVAMLAIVLVMRTFLVSAYFIPSGSMEPTLHGCDGCQGDRVIVNKLAYRLREPRRGEVIVFIAKHDPAIRSLPERVLDFFFGGLGVLRPRETDYIKRIIGLPGDTIQVTDKGVYITPPVGKKFRLREPYILDQHDQGPAQAPFLVPEGRYFVMGDNRGGSSDSRSSLGPIKRSDIIGKAFVKVWPVPRIGLLHAPCYPQRVPLVRCPAIPAASPSRA